MDFELLGPLSVTRGGVTMPISGIHQRAVLAYLLLHDNEVIATSRLLRTIWGTDAPRTARKMLQNAVSGLRGTLAAGDSEAPILLTHAPGYLLQVDPARIDHRRFRDLAEQGRGELRAGQSAAAAHTLREALAIWRGDALADLVELGFDWPELGVLRESRLAAVEDCLDAELAGGRHHEVIGELEIAFAAEPLRERLCGLLMVAAYRCGRQRDALAAYRELRERLVDEVGVDPGDSLRELERGILNHDAALLSPNGAPAAVLPFQRTNKLAASVRRTAPTPQRREPSRDHVTVVLVTSAAEHAAEVGEFVTEQICQRRGIAVPSPGSSWCGLFSSGADHAERALAAASTIARSSTVDFPAASVRVAMHTGEAMVSGTDNSPAVPAGVLDSCRRLAAATAPGRVVVNTLSDDLRMSEPARIAQVLGLPLLGRSYELDLLCGMLRKVRATHRASLVTLVGEAGIGKTRLIEELASSIEDCGVEPTQVLRATATEGSTASTMFADLIRDHLGDDTTDADIHAAVGTDDSAELAEACLEFLREIAGDTPTVVIVENIRRADDDLLVALAALTEGADVPLLVLAAARPEAVEHMSGWSLCQPNALNLVLDRLPDAAIRRLLNILLAPQHRVPRPHARAVRSLDPRDDLLASIAGNPGLAVEYAQRINSVSSIAKHTPALSAAQ